MTALEVIAAIFAIFVLVKIVVVVINPRVWMKNVAEPLLGNPSLATAIYAILAIVVGYFVFVRVPVTHVAAAMLFTALVTGIGLLPYAHALLKIAEEISATRSTLLRKAWLSMVVWVGIALWVLASVFA